MFTAFPLPPDAEARLNMLEDALGKPDTGKDGGQDSSAGDEGTAKK